MTAQLGEQLFPDCKIRSFWDDIRDDQNDAWPILAVIDGRYKDAVGGLALSAMVTTFGAVVEAIVAFLEAEEEGAL